MGRSLNVILSLVAVTRNEGAMKNISYDNALYSCITYKRGLNLLAVVQFFFMILGI